MASHILTGFIGVLHVYILVLEMFLWTKRRTRKIFGLSLDDARTTKVLAGNQGLYNGFLALGLFWSVVCSDPNFSIQLKVFFLGCVVMAGIYGGVTASKKIIYVQALPAFVALAISLYSFLV